MRAGEDPPVMPPPMLQPDEGVLPPPTAVGGPL